MDTVTHTNFEAAAHDALSKHNWRVAALLFTEAADEIPDDVNGFVPARALGLRRDAHLALCRTEEFKSYRENARKRGCRDFRAEWEEPSGELVCRPPAPQAEGLTMLLDLILSSRLFNWFFGTMHGRDERDDVAPGRIVASALALSVLAGCGGGGGAAPIAVLSAPTNPNPQPEQPPKSEPICSVTLYGDSVLHGGTVAGRLAEPPAAALKRMRPLYRVVDRSSNGDYVLLRLPSFLADQIDTRFVVIEHGINDGGQNLDYREPLRSMVQRVKALGRTPIVTGLSRVRGAPPWRDNYDALARQVAKEEGAIFADWGAASYSDADMADDVHPAQPYSTRLMEQLVGALDRAAPECRP